MMDKNSFNNFISKEAKIDGGVTIFPNVQIIGKCEIKKGTVVHSGSVIKDSKIGENCEIKSSYIDDSLVENDVKIGPFANIRPGSVIQSRCKIGNFVEIKNSTLKEGTKASHLAYIGDAEVGKNCNIGCGAIFVNYSGKTKSKIVVEDNCFIGSNCNLIAPVFVAKNSYICAGSTLTKSTKENDFVIARAREIIKPGRAKNYIIGED